MVVRAPVRARSRFDGRMLRDSDVVEVVVMFVVIVVIVVLVVVDAARGGYLSSDLAREEREIVYICPAHIKNPHSVGF